MLKRNGDGTNLAVDDVGSPPRHYQQVKLVDGTVDSTAVIPGTTANGLTVDVTRVSGTVTTDPSDRAARLVGQVEGRNAHGDATPTGNAVRQSVRASAAQVAAVTDSSAVDLFANRHGELRVAGGPPAGTMISSISVPIANTQATATKAAGAAGVRNVCVAITAVIAAGATAPAVFQGVVNLIDGATGGTTFLWRANISITAVAGAMNSIVLSRLWIPGTAATAMTLEFNAAGGLNTFESVALVSTQITE